ncbi:transcription factor HES-5-like [Engraulis encrasicolus]|uniref:transcription factor HES-5-like n=1 Tax=Engraulis encrasicolus TaxID=184585 RepID=UPI002FD4F550
MAPTITTTADHPKDYMSLPHKVRKPIVEKLRRDRINNSIEELKALLGPQLQNQQPESKLEKADILEMTVCLLRQHLQQKNSPSVSNAASQGYSRCAEETIHFLSRDPLNPQSRAKLLTQLQTFLQSPSDVRRGEMVHHDFHSTVLGKDTKPEPSKSSPWRPW